MLQVYIEAAAGSAEKNLYDEQTLVLKGVRQVARPYPYPYGFILGTRSADGDAVDCYVITPEPLPPGTWVECEPIGLLEQAEGEETDHKVLATLPGQPVVLNEMLHQELQDFIYAVFAAFPGAQVHVGRILPRAAALQYLQTLRSGEP